MSADSGKDRLGDKLRDLEHAREDVYFAARDRALIEKMRAEASAGSWHAEVIDLLALVRAVAAGSAPIEALLPNQEFLDREAVRAAGTLDLPGVRPVEREPK